MTDPVVLPMPADALVKENRQISDVWYEKIALVANVTNGLIEANAGAQEGLATKAAKVQPDAGPGVILFADDGDYPFFWPDDASTEVTVDTKARIGTATATLTVNGAPFPGSANAVSTSLNSQVHTGLTLSRGDVINIAISGASGCEGLMFMLRNTRTLA